MATQSATFAAQSQSRSRANLFYPGIAVFAAAVIIFGFARTYYLKEFFDTPSLPLLVHLHGAVMTTWMALFIVQTTLVEKGRVRFSIGADTRVVGPGEVLHFPPGIAHGATMLDEEVVLIDIFTPIREDFLGA